MNNKFYKLIKYVLEIARLIATFILMLIIVAPGGWVVYNAFRHNVDIQSKPAVWAPNFTLDNFAAIFGEVGEGFVPIMQYLSNSLIISITSTIIALVIGISGGYAFARYKFKHKKRLFLWLMLTRTVPRIAMSLPIFIVFAKIGIIDTKIGLIIFYVALNIPFTIWLVEGFFLQIPKDLYEAAMVDGCTRWEAFWKVELPLAKSGIASAAIFAFLIAWNEFAIVSQLSRSVDSKTLPVGLLDFTSEFTINWAGMCAFSVVMIVPALVLTFIVQKHLVSGLTFGGVKG
jgi:multiple sugar transport system permease protein